jgi:hypothetical protein
VKTAICTYGSFCVIISLSTGKEITNMKKNKKQYFAVMGPRHTGRKNSGVLVFFADTPKYNIYYNKIDNKIYLESCDDNLLTDEDKNNIVSAIYKASQYRQAYNTHAAIILALREEI